MNVTRHRLRNATLWASLCVYLALAACVTVPPYTTPVPGVSSALITPVAATDWALRAAAPRPQMIGTNDQAVVSAEIARANAQATLDAAAAIEHAGAEATLVAADSTQSAALAEDAIRQTQTADVATTSAEAAATQTESANAITTQTQIAVQWSANQARQSAEDLQAPIAFLWAWCLPPFVVLLGALALWGFWRWLKIRQTHQEIMDEAIERLQIPAPAAIHRDEEESPPYLEGENVNGRYQVTQPDDPVHRWLEEVKGKLQSGDQKDEDHDADR